MIIPSLLNNSPFLVIFLFLLFLPSVCLLLRIPQTLLKTSVKITSAAIKTTASHLRIRYHCILSEFYISRYSAFPMSCSVRPLSLPRYIKRTCRINNSDRKCSQQHRLYHRKLYIKYLLEHICSIYSGCLYNTGVQSLKSCKDISIIKEPSTIYLRCSTQEATISYLPARGCHCSLQEFQLASTIIYNTKAGTHHQFPVRPATNGAIIKGAIISALITLLPL